MSEKESRHDRVLKRVHLWVGVLGGIVALLIGLHNFKSVFFPAKRPSPPPAESRSASSAAGPTAAAPSPENGGVPPSYEMFKKEDRDGNGKVSQAEWGGTPDALARLDLDGDNAVGPSDFRASFESLDVNRDGFVTLLEWRKVRRAFQAIDRDGDRRISREEFAGRAS